MFSSSESTREKQELCLFKSSSFNCQLINLNLFFYQSREGSAGLFINQSRLQYGAGFVIRQAAKAPESVGIGML